MVITLVMKSKTSDYYAYSYRSPGPPFSLFPCILCISLIRRPFWLKPLKLESYLSSALSGLLLQAHGWISGLSS